MTTPRDKAATSARDQAAAVRGLKRDRIAERLEQRVAEQAALFRARDSEQLVGAADVSDVATSAPADRSTRPT
jgi:hypothetical protein